MLAQDPAFSQRWVCWWTVYHSFQLAPASISAPLKITNPLYSVPTLDRRRPGRLRQSEGRSCSSVSSIVMMP